MLFRAKQTNTKAENWLYGYCYEKKAVWGSWAVIIHEVDECSIQEQTMVERDTICLNTGILDKNGNFVYEKDILLTFDDEFIEVFYNNKTACIDSRIIEDISRPTIIYEKDSIMSYRNQDFCQMKIITNTIDL